MHSSRGDDAANTGNDDSPTEISSPREPPNAANAYMRPSTRRYKLMDVILDWEEFEPAIARYHEEISGLDTGTSTTSTEPSRKRRPRTVRPRLQRSALVVNSISRATCRYGSCGTTTRRCMMWEDPLFSNGVSRGGVINRDDACDVDEVVYSDWVPAFLRAVMQFSHSRRSLPGGDAPFHVRFNCTVAPVRNTFEIVTVYSMHLLAISKSSAVGIPCHASVAFGEL